MAYTKTNFRDGDTLTATHMNNIEDGIIAVENALYDKQDKLYNGINLKTINGESLLGSGDITIKGTEGSGTDIVVDDFLNSTSTNPVQNWVINTALKSKQDKLVSGETLKTINNQTLLGEGNITISGSGSTITIDAELNLDSEYPVQNKVITAALNEKQDKLAIDSQLSEYSTNPVQNKVIKTEFDKKQDKLISGENLKTINGQSLLGNGDITVSGSSAVVNKELKILFIGNSLTQDAVSYLPLLLDEIAPEINYTIYEWYNGGHTLAQQYSKFTSNTPCDIFGIITNNQSGGWQVQNKSVTMSWVCENCDFDIVVVQEYSYYDFNDATEITNFNNVINYLRNNYGKAFKIYSFIDAPMRNRIDNDYAKAKKYAKLHITKSTAEGLVNPGSAVVYGIKDSVLNTLGDRGNLTSDGTHTQEGLPCMLQSYVLALWVFEWLGIPKSVLNSSTIMTADLYANWQSLGPNLGSGVVEGTPAQVRRAQEVAIKAYKNGKLLLNSYLNAMAEEANDAITGGSSSGGSSGGDTGGDTGGGGSTGGDTGGSEPEVPSTPSDTGLSVYEEGVIFAMSGMSVGSYCEFISNNYTSAYDIYSYPVDGTSTYTVNTNNALSSTDVDYPYIIVVCDSANKIVKLIKAQTNKAGARMETYTVDTSTITGAKYLLISTYQDKITVTKDTGGDTGGDAGGDTGDGDTGGDDTTGGNEPDAPPTPSDTGLSIYQERVIFSNSKMEVGSYCKYTGNNYTGVYDIYSYPVDGVSTYTIEMTNALNDANVDYPYIIAVCDSDVKIVELIKAQTNKGGTRKETYVVDTSTIPGAKYLLLSVYNDQITIS